MVNRKREYSLKDIVELSIFWLFKFSCFVYIERLLILHEKPLLYLNLSRYLELLSQKLRRERSRSVGILDVQSVKETALSCQSETGYDAGEKAKGRKRHLLIDTPGLIIAVFITAAN